jgi:3-methyladenine DNA glycosylase AlkD
MMAWFAGERWGVVMVMAPPSAIEPTDHPSGVALRSAMESCVDARFVHGSTLSSVSTAADVRAALAESADPADAIHLQRFFKTGPGEYGEGDAFIGVRVPATRRVVKRFRGLDPGEIDLLLDSDVHEHRLAAVLLLVDAYPADPDAVFVQYLAAVARGRVNNWDLVDASAEHIVGPQVRTGRAPASLLDDLAASPDLWERRVGVLATFDFIKRGDAGPALRLCEALLPDRHDLIQKATGWMLREVGKRVSRDALLGFLDAHAGAMGRTALSYATEHLAPEQRAHYRALRPEPRR